MQVDVIGADHTREDEIVFESYGSEEVNITTDSGDRISVVDDGDGNAVILVNNVAVTVNI